MQPARPAVRPLLSAHRGGGEGVLPPNSLSAISAASDLGADLIEFDVRVTSDDQFVVHHDATIKIGDGNYPIGALTRFEVRRYAPRIASLTEVLGLLAGRTRAHVDLKDTVKEVEIADLCAQFLGTAGFVITSLEDSSVAALRSARPQFATGLSLGRNTEGLDRLAIARVRRSELRPWSRVERCGASFLAVHHRIARLGVLAGARRRGLPVLLWTLNSAELILAAQRDERVWAYTTDLPRLARRLSPAFGYDSENFRPTREPSRTNPHPLPNLLK
ncbi:MAG: glycerophosphodiester phosphodiesterase [Frankiales bacterium]|nr:glycerophosphodiester phosphodiesterase [Frankiales bacterium]